MNKSYRVMGAVAAIIIAMPLLAAAQTDASSSVNVQVQTLLSQIQALEAQLHTLLQTIPTTSAPPTPPTPPSWSNASSTPPSMNGDEMMDNCPSFVRDLSTGSEGNDVMRLQQFLNGEGFFSATSTGFFGPLTANALDQFQARFGISSSSAGFFGPLTRDFIGSLCGNGQGTSHMMGSSTPPMHPMPQGGQGNDRGWMGTSTNTSWQGPQDPMSSSTWHGGPMSSSTPPRPCPQNSSNADQGAAPALFVPHVSLPLFLLDPCNNPPPSSTHAGPDNH